MKRNVEPKLELQKGWEAFTGGSHCRCPEARDVPPFPQEKNCQRPLLRLWNELGSCRERCPPVGTGAAPARAGSIQLLLGNVTWSLSLGLDSADPRDPSKFYGIETCPCPSPTELPWNSCWC